MRGTTPMWKHNFLVIHISTLGNSQTNSHLSEAGFTGFEDLRDERHHPHVET